MGLRRILKTDEQRELFSKRIECTEWTDSSTTNLLKCMFKYRFDYAKIACEMGLKSVLIPKNRYQRLQSDIREAKVKTETALKHEIMVKALMDMMLLPTVSDGDSASRRL